MVSFLIIMAILTGVVLLVLAPLRRPSPPRSDDDAATAHLAELEAARESKYREIRDADLDYRTGKLSEADFTAIDGELRGEAIRILHELDQARSAGAPVPGRAERR